MDEKIYRRFDDLLLREESASEVLENREHPMMATDKQLITDESIRDTLIDLANYALMTVLEMDTEPEGISKVARHKKLCDGLNELYARKNHDYGDSFHTTFVEEGLAMARIRLGDKFSRFKTLSRLVDRNTTNNCENGEVK